MRFLYATAVLLCLGGLFLVLFVNHLLQNTVEQVVHERLYSVRMLLSREVEHQKRFLLAQAASTAAMIEVQSTLMSHDADRLRHFALPLADVVRQSLHNESFLLIFHDADNKLLYQTSLAEPGEPGAGCETLAARVLSTESPATGLVVRRDGIYLIGCFPIIAGKQLVGTVTTGMALDEAADKLRLSQGVGVSLFADSKTAGPLLSDKALGDVDGLVLLRRMGDARLDYVRPKLENKEKTDLGLWYRQREFHSVIEFPDVFGNRLAVFYLSLDAGGLQQEKWDRLAQFLWSYLVGAVLLWMFLFLNVARIEGFLARLKRIILASHSNYFAERFESDHVHCLEVLHCNNEECPVYKNPSLVCYLETGSEAISPQWRDTCIFLNKYDTCKNCPVYLMRRGDELSEMRNIVNTMMRLWSNFLSRVGHLLGYVLRSQERNDQPPSLDEVSKRLEQMARLTFFGHDLQGVMTKEEVYQQLAWVFEKTYNLHQFILFEVHHDTDVMLPIIDGAEGRPLCREALSISAESCRAKRMAEDVNSYFNPMLCPHFNCNPDDEFRWCLPMVMSGQVGALFTFVASRRDWERIQDIQPVIRKYLDETSPVLSSLHLLQLSKEQALRDPLTKCHNRRFLDEFITKYEPISEREGKRAGFLMADIDFFKQVNDRYGHEAGDQVLKQVVELMRGAIRRSDLLIRYGGEEFLILLQDPKPESSMEIAEKIRLAVEQHRFELPGGVTIFKTISIGTAVYPTQADSMYKAIKFADVALYEAKKTGRNRVISFEPFMWTEENF